MAGATGGVGIIVAAGQSGLLPPVGSASDFATAVAQLLREPELRQALAEGARHKIMREHDLPIAAHRLAAILDEAAA